MDASLGTSKITPNKNAKADKVTCQSGRKMKNKLNHYKSKQQTISNLVVLARKQEESKTVVRKKNKNNYYYHRDLKN